MIFAGDSIAHAVAVDLAAPSVAFPGAKIAALPEQLAAVPAEMPLTVSVGVNDALQLDEPLDLAGLDALRGRSVRFLPILFRPRLPWQKRYPVVHDKAAVIRAALVEVGPVVPYRLHYWQWAPDGIHPNRLGRAKIIRAVT